MDDRILVEPVMIGLRQIVRSIDIHSHRLFKACGLTNPQLVILREIDRHGPMSPSDLARGAKLSNATITGILRRLETRGCVSRRSDERDRRRQLISLTPEGQTALEAAPTMIQDKLSRAITGLKDWEQSLLLSSIQRLAEAMDAETLEAAPILSTGSLTADPDPDATPPDDPKRV